MKVFYFSGTGNARRTAHWIKEEAEQQDVSVELVDIQPVLPISPTPTPTPAPPLSDHRTNALSEMHAAPLIGFVFPIHGFTTIWAMLHFLFQLPRGNRATSVFCVATTGGARIGPVVIPGWEGSGLYLPLLILWLKGYKCVGAIPLRSTPENWTSLVPSCTAAANKTLMAATQPRVVKFIQTILSGQKKFTGCISLLFGIAVFPISVLYLLMGRFFLAKMMFASSRCNACGFCEQYCPMSAVRLINKRPFWSITCESCMRCMNYCPQKAVQASWLMAIVVSVTLLLPVSRWITEMLRMWLPVPTRALTIVSWCMAYPFKLGCLVIAYRLWFVTLKWKPVNRFFEYSSPTRFFKRYHEADTPLSDWAQHK